MLIDNFESVLCEVYPRPDIDSELRRYSRSCSRSPLKKSDFTKMLERCAKRNCSQFLLKYTTAMDIWQVSLKIMVRIHLVWIMLEIMRFYNNAFQYFSCQWGIRKTSVLTVLTLLI